MTTHPNREPKDGWYSYGVIAKGVLVERIGTWKVHFTNVKLREDPWMKEKEVAPPK
jgi:hypothetical protein